MLDEPGMYAFYHPNCDLGIGSARSPVDAQAMAPRLVMRHAILTHHPVKCGNSFVARMSEAYPGFL